MTDQQSRVVSGLILTLVLGSLVWPGQVAAQGYGYADSPDKSPVFNRYYLQLGFCEIASLNTCVGFLVYTGGSDRIGLSADFGIGTYADGLFWTGVLHVLARQGVWDFSGGGAYGLGYTFGLGFQGQYQAHTLYVSGMWDMYLGTIGFPLQVKLGGSWYGGTDYRFYGSATIGIEIFSGAN